MAPSSEINNEQPKKVYYVDTNIIIDAALSRKNPFGKDIAKPALKFFTKAASCQFYLGISTWTLEELDKEIDLQDLKMFFELIKKKIVTMTYSTEDVEVAKQKSKEHYKDALHIIIAERQKVDCIVTRNKDHFVQIGTKLPVKKPEELS